jgi:hypothetical protein
MKNKNIKLILTFWIFCMMLIHPNPPIPSQNPHRIKSSDEEDTNIIKEDLNDTLKFTVNNTRDVTAFRLSYIVNHTNGSSFYDELGGMGDIFGVDILPSKLRFWTISKTSLLLYNEGGYLYNFLMKVYWINPIYGGTFDAGHLFIESSAPENEDEEDEEGGEGGEEDEDTPKENNNSYLPWIVFLGAVIILGIYAYFRPKKKATVTSQSNENPKYKDMDIKSVNKIEKWKKKFNSRERS